MQTDRDVSADEQIEQSEYHAHVRPCPDCGTLTGHHESYCLHSERDDDDPSQCDRWPDGDKD